MLEMISTLLDISRLEDGRMPLTLGSFHITSVVERAISGLSTWAQDRQIVIQTALSQDLPLVYVDQELVVRVVQNLLGNAIKFSHRGSTVLVRAELANTDSSSLCISVSDRGIGIAPKDQEKIFAKFGQAGDHHTGTGLGLTFCKLVVEAHKGQIWVESQLGHGSTFYFTIPLA
jgi:signal transduction histidine kinase